VNWRAKGYIILLILLPPYEARRRVNVLSSTKPKRLYRSSTNRILGGVCGGLGEYFDLDPNIIRLLWVVFTLISAGAGILAYLIAWILLPERSTGSIAHEFALSPTAGKLCILLGVVILAVGVALLLHELFGPPWIFWFLWAFTGREARALLLILVGVLLLIFGIRQS